MVFHTQYRVFSVNITKSFTNKSRYDCTTKVHYTSGKKRYMLEDMALSNASISTVF